MSFVYLLAATVATANAAPDTKALPQSPPDVALPMAPPPPPGSVRGPTSVRGPNMAATPRNSPANWVNELDYPGEALRDGRSGTTSFQVTINKWGRVSDCVITQTSGHADIDNATCQMVAIRGLFWPKTDTNSTAIDGGLFNSRIRWAIPENIPASAPPSAPPLPVAVPFFPTLTYPRGPAIENYGWNIVAPSDYPAKALKARAEGIVKISLTVNPDGSRQDCRVLESSGHADLDSKSCAIVMERLRVRPALDVGGNPTKGRIDAGVEWKLPVAK